MASGWNLWVWLQCIGVASRCCCKDVTIAGSIGPGLSLVLPLLRVLFHRQRVVCQYS